MPVTVGYRRLQALIQYTAFLAFNVPPPTEQRNVLDKLAAKQIQRKINKKEDGGHSSDSSTRSSHNSLNKVRPQSDADLKRRERKKEERRSKRQDKKDAKAHENRRKKLEKEQKIVGRMEHIVVESLNRISY